MPNGAEVIYVGIDPGVGGGLVAISPSRLAYTPMPKSEDAIWQWFKQFGGDLHTLAPEVVAVIEQISPGFGGTGKTQMAKLYGSYRALRAFLIAADIFFISERSSVIWRGLGIEPRGKEETPSRWKNRLKAKAQELFPDIRVTLKIADALLIAKYCKAKLGSAI